VDKYLVQDLLIFDKGDDLDDIGGSEYPNEDATSSHITIFRGSLDPNSNYSE
jgi:hypothetical protein